MICIMIMKEAARMSSLFRSLNKDEKEKENLRKISPARPGRQSRPKTAPAKSKKVSLLFLTEKNLITFFLLQNLCSFFRGAQQPVGQTPPRHPPSQRKRTRPPQVDQLLQLS